MYFIEGIDIGSDSMKNHKKQKFRSTIKKKDETVVDYKNSIELEYEGETYIIGSDDGDRANGLNKSSNRNNLLLVLAMLAHFNTQSMIDVSLVTGIPVARYVTEKDAMRKMFQKTNHKVIINGVEKIINIRNCVIVPEGMGAFLSQPLYKEGLIVDIGGLSVDTAHITYKNGTPFIKKNKTYPLGLIPLNIKIANLISNICEEDFNVFNHWDVEQRYFYNRGKKIPFNDIPDIQQLEEQHANKIYTSLKTDYGLSNMPKILFAGGGIKIHKLLKRKIEGTKEDQNFAIALPDSQYANAIGYHAYGKLLLC